MLLREQQIPQGTKRVRARGGKSRGRAGGWGRTLLLLSCLLAWSSVIQNPSLPGFNSYVGVLDRFV